MSRSTLKAAPISVGLGLLVFAAGLVAAPLKDASPTRGASAEHARVVEHWTPARMAAAMPRDLVIDEHGQGFMKKPDGSLVPYGQQVAGGVSIKPNAKPVGGGGGGGGTGDTTPPAVTPLSPLGNETIGTSHTFSATVTDASGLRSVSFRVGKVGSRAQSFTASRSTGDAWVASLSGFTAGDWTWNVVAKDPSGNTTTTSTVAFKVSTGGSSGGSIVTNAEWTSGGAVQTAMGRIYFEMPTNTSQTTWGGYVCSGTVATDNVSGRSVIQTAAHCVYDDAYKTFARNVMFIPNQAGTTGTRTDGNCANDPLGCWTTAFGVVDMNWTTRTFPNNVTWDYAYYVVNDTGAHTAGFQAGVNPALDQAAGSLPLSFAVPLFNVSNSTSDYTRALGYSYSDDPNFMYCAQDMTQRDAANWWLGSCALSGGSSGGAWIQPMDTATGSGNIISVNSWGYTTQPGMAGPKLSGTSAKCVFELAKTGAPATGQRGVIFNAPCP